MQIRMLEPKGKIWEGMAKKVNLPAFDGEICVLDFHQPFMVELKKGYMRVPGKSILIKEGLAFMQSNELLVFVER